MTERNRRLISLCVTLALVGGNLAALNVLLAGWSGARVDMTAGGQFSVSSATRRLLDSLDEELTIHGYFSGRTHPKLAPLVPQISDLLAEYAAVSRGKVHVDIVDPGENTAIEDEAATRFGVRSTPFRLATKYEAAIVNAYFSLVVRYGDQYVRYGFQELIDVEPTPDGDLDVRLRNLEYDLTRAIKKVVYGFRSTHELFERLDQPARLIAVWTPAQLPEMLAETPEVVREAAEELRKTGGDRFVFEEIDPAGNEALQQELLSRFGAQPMTLGLFGGETFYLYGFLQLGERFEPLPFTAEALTAATVRESVEHALRRHVPGFLKTVGIAAPGGPDIPPELRMQLQMPMPEPEFEELRRVLGEDYRTEDVDLSRPDGVPPEVDVLLVLEPKRLDDRAVRHLDDYLMRGGRIVICAGRFDVDFGAQGLALSPIETGLEEWLDHFGIAIRPTLVLDDRNQPLPIPTVRQTPFGPVRTWELAPYPYLVQVQADGLLQRDLTAQLESVGIYWGSPLEVDESKNPRVQVTPLLQSSPLSWTDDDTSRTGSLDYEVPADSEPHLLAVALSGRFTSAFAAPTETDESPEGGSAEPGAARSNLSESPETRLVVIGNSEFLSDFVARALSPVDGSFFVENLRFAQNVLDWTTLDNDMLEIRARSAVSRRLPPIEPGSRASFELASYAIPPVLLVALGLALRWRRRQTAQIEAGDAQREAAAFASGGSTR